MNMPPPPLGCDLQDLVQRGLAKVMDRHDVNVMMAYHLAGGGPEAREAGAQWLAQAVGPIDPALVLPAGRCHRRRTAGVSGAAQRGAPPGPRSAGHRRR
ncbi:hypothetical protein G6F61_014741 [Rhizopus arrhizus]|nr:hypothetical protein G6F61_014741 [Rhizopus arrhizus]